MDFKALVIGILLAALLLMSMGARRSSEAPAPQEGRYQLFTSKNAMGKDVWTIFDTAEGEAKVFIEDTVRRISYAENRIEEVK